MTPEQQNLAIQIRAYDLSKERERRDAWQDWGQASSQLGCPSGSWIHPDQVRPVADAIYRKRLAVTDLASQARNDWKQAGFEMLRENPWHYVEMPAVRWGEYPLQQLNEQQVHFAITLEAGVNFRMRTVQEREADWFKAIDQLGISWADNHRISKVAQLIFHERNTEANRTTGQIQDWFKAVRLAQVNQSVRLPVRHVPELEPKHTFLALDT